MQWKTQMSYILIIYIYLFIYKIRTLNAFVLSQILNRATSNRLWICTRYDSINNIHELIILRELRTELI